MSLSKSLFAALVLVAALSAVTGLFAADVFDCTTGDGCTGTIYTAGGVPVPVEVDYHGSVRVGSGHTFVGSGGTWVLRQPPE
ncbi:MAG: hypothetical protein DHS20C15_27770 [Planctomycetota bacterium]|nr:MAG: hypothetical protein DHS20C15_27770 [Planctomycetota bacterium]